MHVYAILSIYHRYPKLLACYFILFDNYIRIMVSEIYFVCVYIYILSHVEKLIFDINYIVTISFGE